MRRSRGGVRGVPPPPRLENENLLNLRNKIIANKPLTPSWQTQLSFGPTPLSPLEKFSGFARYKPFYYKIKITKPLN